MNIYFSAGCGRTGAIIAIDYARKMIEQRVCFDIFDYLFFVWYQMSSSPFHHF